MFDSIDKIIERIVVFIEQTIGRKKRCHNCNARNPLNAHHCMHCGVEL